MKGCCLLLLASAAVAQNEPRAGYSFPAGAPRGSTVEVQVGGRFLQGASAAFVSGPGVTATVRSYSRPLTPKERQELRDLVQKLEPQRRDGSLDAAGREQLADAKAKLAASPRQPMNPQLAETVVLTITVAADAPTGPRDLRLQTAAGLGNPLRFVIGDGRTARETEPNEQQGDAQAAAALPVTVDGQLMPGDVDRFRVQLQQGQRLVAAVQARALMPYLADAVPGWCQATLAVRDVDGHELAFADDYRFDPDPRLEFDVPADGSYEVEVRDALSRGREDFVYRLSLHTTVPGSTAASTVTAPLPTGPYVPIAEREPNDSLPTALPIVLPALVIGRIERPGDVDVFTFEGRPGQTFVAEVEARRLGSPLDAVIKLLDPRGRELARCDDHVDLGAGLVTHQADAYVSAKLATAGSHQLVVRDLQGKGGQQHTYRLRIGPPTPDFALRVVPSQVNLRRNSAAVLTVHALRRDGFAGEISLSLLDAAGFHLGGGVVPAGQDRVQVTLSPPDTPAATPVELVLQGTATIGRQQVTHQAVPAEDMMQAFAWHHLVPSAQLLALAERAGNGIGRLVRKDEAPIRLRPGGTTEAVFNLAGARRTFAASIDCTLRDPPAGITVAGTRLERDGFHVVLQADKTVARGLTGNLILVATIGNVAATPPARTRQQRPRASIVLPAVRFVVAK